MEEQNWLEHSSDLLVAPVLAHDVGWIILPIQESKLMNLLEAKTFHDTSSTSLVHGETPTPAQNSNDNASTMAITDLQDLVGWTFLMDEHEDGQCFCAQIIECCHKMDDHIKF